MPPTLQSPHEFVSFCFWVYLSVFFAALSFSALSMPFWRSWSLRVGLVDDPGRRKIHTEPTSLAGGLAVMTGLVLPLVLGTLVVKLGLWKGDVVQQLSYGLNRRAFALLAILLGSLGMVLLGWLDDKHELPPSLKFIGQLVLATLTASSGVRITLFVDSALFSYCATILWILTVTNAFNFMDNMNGLCGGLGAVSSACFALIAARQGQFLVASISLLCCGALIGFLPHNFPRASVFLGDAGSHLVGYLLSVLAILPHFYTSKNPRILAVFSPLLILAVPLIDLVWVVLLRWRSGQPFYVGDTNHLSHRLVRSGLSRPAAVLLIWTLAAILGGLAVLAQ
jgi:UDP-GlcNAc:undecaprenyl-phosphate GlcNAc-1-phosphate transferase